MCVCFGFYVEFKMGCVCVCVGFGFGWVWVGFGSGLVNVCFGF